MFTILHIFVLAALAATSTGSSVTTSSPTVATSSAVLTSSCIPWTSATAKFDHMTPGATPTNGFQGADWSGWVVVEAGYYGFKAKSGKNAIQAPSYEGAQLSSNDSWIIGLQSFDFACVLEIYDTGEFAPQSCAITVVAISGIDWHFPIDGYGPFNFDVNYGSEKRAPMASVTLDDAYATDFVFSVFSAGSSAVTLFFDNMVWVNPNPKCPTQFPPDYAASKQQT